ncbi:hypothetical protein MUP32_00325, partial [Candidatus Microgenomates bacterium]|nr:hypothetical protein [Candidatus Microgenomates bacterium]
MSSPEHGHRGGDARPDLMKRLSQLLHNLFRSKAEKEMAERVAAGADAQKKYAEEETKEKWERERRKREERDRARKYHEAKSGEVAEAEAEVVRQQRAQDVRKELNRVVN